MARNASTYRQARREMARILRLEWETFNSQEYWDREEWFCVFGNVRASNPSADAAALSSARAGIGDA